MTTDLPPALLWGLRRYLAAPAAVVTSWQRQSFPGGFSGSTFEYWRLRLRRAGVQSNITLVYKRGNVAEGVFLGGSARREVHVYAHLAEALPLTLPTVVAFDLASGDLWLLPFPPVKYTSHWLADWERSDVENALADLAKLHAAFWDAADMLARWPWLAHPTTTDAPVLAAEGARGLGDLIALGEFDDCLTPARLRRLHALAVDPTTLLSTLNAGPHTLLHGDAGFQNIAITLDGRQRLWYDWQLAAAGPPALDLITFLHPWHYPDARPPLSPADMIATYLSALAQRGYNLAPDVFERQLDAALLWRWLCQWAPLFGQYRARLRPEVRQRLCHVFELLHWPALDHWP